MARDLARLFRPRHVAVIGGGAWCAEVAAQVGKAGFSGPVWRVHPRADPDGRGGTFVRLGDLPEAPDAVFIGINRDATIATVQELSTMGAGGAVCFASGFSEAAAEDAAGRDLQMALVQAAGEMPILGPNCYGFINALNGVALWPDQHGCQPVERGVAILTQSSNIAINLTMQRRALPIAMVVACGNAAQTGQAEIALSLLDDPRISAIGLHIEGFGDLRQWESLAACAQAKGVALVALKVGRSGQARAAAVSHTAALSGSDAGAAALLARLGIARVGSLAELVEALKLLHVTGPLAGGRIASISCSGGEAGLAADSALGRALEFPPLGAARTAHLSTVLGPRVALANPLDYHTYIWRDQAAMTEAWAAMTGPDLDLTMAVVDYPRSDMCDGADWECATYAALAVRAQTGANFAVVATLPELMPEDVARTLMAGGVAPLCGLPEAMAAVEAARARVPEAQPLLLPGAAPREVALLDEATAKARLAGFGLDVPAQRLGADPEGLSFPVVLKRLGLAHKSEAGAVALGLETPEKVADAAQAMGEGRFLVEEMVTGGVAELLVGVVRDPAHGFVLTLGAGGVQAEILRDSQALLVPASRAA
ncbi:MAG TPA: CoA-binding protein, partial [Aliiroseovarius sp.]|nr:CoA-binding protein [Aliiroseovarius sp.]